MDRGRLGDWLPAATQLWTVIETLGLGRGIPLYRVFSVLFGFFGFF